MGKPGNRKALTILLFALYLLLLAAIILFKLPFYSFQISDGIRTINLIPLRGTYNSGGFLIWREILDNILLYIPLGIYLCMLKSEWRFAKKALSAAALSCLFEVAQFIFALGRSDITDILDNTLSGMIGIGVYALPFVIFGNKTTKIVNILAFVTTIGVVPRFAQLFFLSHFVMKGLQP